MILFISIHSSSSSTACSLSSIILLYVVAGSPQIQHVHIIRAWHKHYLVPGIYNTRVQYSTLHVMQIIYYIYETFTARLPVVTKDLPISAPRFTPYDFLSRCKFSTLTTRQLIRVEFYLLTFPRFFPLRKKEHKSYFDGKNGTHDFRTN